ncbi:hypothetical protein H8L32_17900 [Undibacterium sp. CY18W]|uniref:Uncharacterized protein n=1 Tax=Undibacterium hunanense TaxID=2762292 RepID=A0ABR6ZU30_9BURK|nr:hypothetical protein [Undibacterium hunanense]MBC3919369.1 hypothetical protein [Undibacterium hunanense]
MDNSIAQELQMYTPRLQYADQPVLRPKRVHAEAPQLRQKPVTLKQHATDLSSIFKRLANSGQQD